MNSQSGQTRIGRIAWTTTPDSFQIQPEFLLQKKNKNTISSEPSHPVTRCGLLDINLGATGPFPLFCSVVLAPCNNLFQYKPQSKNLASSSLQWPLQVRVTAHTPKSTPKAPLHLHPLLRTTPTTTSRQKCRFVPCPLVSPVRHVGSPTAPALVEPPKTKI